MQAHADVLPLTAKVARQPSDDRVARAKERCESPEFDKYEVGRDAYAAHDNREAGIGSVVVPSIWLAFYVIAAAHSLASSF
jgi:hypothetical protein